MVKGEFFRAGLAYAMSKKFVIYFTQKNVSRFEFKKRGCEITVSTEKEDLSFKMNERSSFMLKLTCDENFNYKL